METTYLVRPGDPGPIEARVTAPDGEPGQGGRQAALSHAFYQLGYSDLWGEQRMGEDAALTYSAVWACVRVISEAISCLGWHVYARSADGRSRLPIENNEAWLLDLQANPETSALDWRQKLLKDALLSGNGYAEIERTGMGKPHWLWQLDRRRVRPDRFRGQLVYEVENGSGMKNTVLPPRDVYHLKGLGEDGIVGYGVVELARKAIRLGLQEEQFGVSFFEKGPMPGGILKVPQQLTMEARAKLQADAQRLYGGGSRNAGRILVLMGGQEFSPLDLNNADAQFLESRKFQVTELCRWFGVPPHKLADLDRATFCLPAGQTVLTEDGPKAIETIEAGEMVWSREQDQGLRLARVTRTGCTGSDPVLTIRTTNRSLRCNAKHPILCRRKSHVPKTVQTIGGAVTPFGVCDVVWETMYVPAGELLIGDTIVTLDRLPDGGSLESCPTRLPSVGFMEFCGLLLGDGNVIRNKAAGSAYVTIARAAGATYMDYYREVIISEFTGRSDRPVRLQEGERQTRFSSARAVGELVALGLSGNARNKRVPGWVFRLPESHRLAFLRGFLDADGSCDKRGRLSFSSCNGAMLGQIRSLCIGCGVPVTNMRLQRGTTTLPNGKRKEFAQFTFTCSDPLANRRISSRTPTYVARLEAGQPFSHKERAYPWHGGRTFGEPGLSLARINSIEVGPVEPVYDLTVEGSHSFIAEGIIVHNSNVEEQERAFVTDCLTIWARRLESEADVKLFGPVQTGRRYTKLNLDARLRGNSQTQTSTVTQKVTGGIMTINEARAYFDLNPIDGGDTPLVQGAMVPLERVLEEPEPEPAPPPEPVPGPEPAEAPEGEPAGARPGMDDRELDEIFGCLLTDAYARLLRVEADKARRAANKGRLEAHVAAYYTQSSTEHIHDMLLPILQALALALGQSSGRAEAWADRAAVLHVEQSRARLLDDYRAALDCWEQNHSGECARATLRAIYQEIHP